MGREGAVPRVSQSGSSVTPKSRVRRRNFSHGSRTQKQMTREQLINAIKLYFIFAISYCLLVWMWAEFYIQPKYEMTFGRPDYPDYPMEPSTRVDPDGSKQAAYHEALDAYNKQVRTLDEEYRVRVERARINMIEAFDKDTAYQSAKTPAFVLTGLYALGVLILSMKRPQ